MGSFQEHEILELKFRDYAQLCTNVQFVCVLWAYCDTGTVIKGLCTAMQNTKSYIFLMWDYVQLWKYLNFCVFILNTGEY